MSEQNNVTQVIRRQVGAFLLGLGFLLLVLGARPEWFGLSLAPAIGFMQILTFLTGLGFVTFGLYLRLLASWHANGALPLRADLGMRIAVTGYILAAVAALADVLGLGSHPLPNETYFGPWQYTGLLLGLGMLVVGYAIAWPWKVLHHASKEDAHHEGTDGGHQSQGEAGLSH